MRQLPVIITEGRQRRSTGRIRDGRIVINLSGHLSAKVRDEHVRFLTATLNKRAEKLDGVPMPEGDGAEPITTLSELRCLAEDLNSEHYGFDFDRIGWRKQETRWGSCSIGLKRIHMSHRLIGAPRDLVSYVIIHELCHLARADHSREFWSLVRRACPEYKLRRLQLEAWELRKPPAALAPR